MAGITSLLRSAQATRKKLDALEESQIAFQWESSAQTYEDYLAYSGYLRDKAEKTQDPSDRLSYASKLRTANRVFTSNELQREQQAIMEGRGSTQDKMEAVKRLYDRALDNQDFNLAQNLVTQWDGLSIKLQNEAESAQKAMNAFAAAGVRASDNALKDMVASLTTKGDGLIQTPDGRVLKGINLLNGEFTANGATEGGQMFKEAADTLAYLQEVIINAYNGAGTQEAADAIEEKYGKFVDGTATLTIGGQKLTAQEIGLAAASQDSNNPLFQITNERDDATGNLKYKLARNKTEDFIWANMGEDADGNAQYQALPVQTSARSDYRNLDSQVTDEGYFVSNTDIEEKNGEKLARVGKTDQRIKRDEGLSIKNRLEAMGIIATPGSDGKLSLQIPGVGTVEGVVGTDGNVRFFGEKGNFSGDLAGLYEISLFNRSDFKDGVAGKNFGDIREVAPDEGSMFGQRSKFGGDLSKMTTQGSNVVRELAGTVTSANKLLSGDMAINPFGARAGFGVSATDNMLQGSSQLLMKAEGLQEQRRKQEELRMRAAEQLQQATAFNLNQMGAVPQMSGSSGAPIKQLQVKPIAPVTRNLKVTAPPPVQYVNAGVKPSTATYTNQGVKPLPYQGRVTVR